MKKRITRCLLLLVAMLTVLLGCEQVIETSSIKVAVPAYEGAAEYQITVGDETRTIELASKLSFIIKQPGTYDVSAKALDADGNVLAAWNKEVSVVMGQELEMPVEFKAVPRTVTFNISAVEGGTAYFISLDGAQDEQITAENGKYIYKAEMAKGSHEVKVTVKNESGDVIVVENKTVEVGSKDISLDIQCKIKTMLHLTVPAYEDAASYVVKVDDDIRTIESCAVLEYEFDKACTVAVSVEARNAKGNVIARYNGNVEIVEVKDNVVAAEFQTVYKNVTFKVAEVANAVKYYIALDGNEAVELKNPISLSVGSHTAVITARDAEDREMGTVSKVIEVGEVDATVDISLNLYKRVFLALKNLDGATRYVVNCGGNQIYDGAYKAESIYAVVGENSVISVNVYKGNKQIATWFNSQQIIPGENNITVGEYDIVNGKITVEFTPYEGADSYKVFVGTKQLPSDNTIAVANGTHKIRIEAYDAAGIMIAEKNAEVAVNYNDLTTEKYVLEAKKNTLDITAKYDPADSYKVSIDGKPAEVYTAPITLNCGKHTVSIEAMKGSVVYAKTGAIEITVRHDKGAVLDNATFTPVKGKIEFTGMEFDRAKSYEVSIDGKVAEAPYEVSYGTHAIAIKALDSEKRVVATWNGDVIVEEAAKSVAVSFAEIFREVTFKVAEVANAAKYYIAIDGSKAVELKNPIKLNVGTHRVVITARDAEDREMASLEETVVVNDADQSVPVTLNLYTRVFITLEKLDGATRYVVNCGGTQIYDGVYKTESIYAVVGDNAAISVDAYKNEKKIASWVNEGKLNAGDNAIAVDGYKVINGKITVAYTPYEGAAKHVLTIDGKPVDEGAAFEVINGNHKIRIEAYDADDIMIAEKDAVVTVNYNDVTTEKYVLDAKKNTLDITAKYELADSYKVSIDGQPSEIYTAPITLNCGKHIVSIEALKGSVVYAKTGDIEVTVRHDNPASIDTATFIPEKGKIEFTGMEFDRAKSYEVSIDSKVAGAPYEVSYGTHAIAIKALDSEKRVVATWNGDVTVEEAAKTVAVSFAEVFREVTFNVEKIAKAAKYYIVIDESEAVELKNPVKLNVGSHRVVITARDAEDREMASLEKTVVVNDVDQSVSVTLDLYTRVFITLENLDGATRYVVNCGGNKIYDGAYIDKPIYAVVEGTSASIDIAVSKADGKQIASFAKTYSVAKGDNKLSVDTYEVNKANISVKYNLLEGADSYKVFVDNAPVSAEKAIPVENGKHDIRIEAYQGDILIAEYKKSVDVFYDDIDITADLTAKKGSLVINAKYDPADSYKVSIDGKPAEVYTAPITLNYGKHTVSIEALKGSVVYAKTAEIEVTVRHDIPVSIDTAIFTPEKGKIKFSRMSFVGADSYVVEIDGSRVDAPYEVIYGSHDITVKALAADKEVANWTGTVVVDKPSVDVNIVFVPLESGGLSIDVATVIEIESRDTCSWYLNDKNMGSLTIPGRISVNDLEPGDYTVKVEVIAPGNNRFAGVSKTYTVENTRIEDSLTVDYISDPNNTVPCYFTIWNLTEKASFKIDDIEYNTSLYDRHYNIDKNLPYGHHVIAVTDDGVVYEYRFEVRGYYSKELSLIDGKLTELSGSTPYSNLTVSGAELKTPVEYSVEINGDYSGFELKWFLDGVEVVEAKNKLSMSHTFIDLAAVGSHEVGFEMYQPSTGRYRSNRSWVEVVEKADVPVFTINPNLENVFYDYLDISGQVTGNVGNLWKFRWFIDDKPYKNLSSKFNLYIDSYNLRNKFNEINQDPLRSYNLKLQAERSGADPVVLYTGNFTMEPSYRIYCSDIYEGMDFNVEINSNVDSKFSESYIKGVIVNGTPYSARPNRDSSGYIRNYTVSLPDSFKTGTEVTISVDVSKGKSESITKTIESGSAKISLSRIPSVGDDYIMIGLENNNVFPADAEMHWYLNGDISRELYVRSNGGNNVSLADYYYLDVPVDVVPGTHSIHVEITCNGKTFKSNSISFDMPKYEYRFLIDMRRENDVPVEAWVASYEYDMAKVKPASYKWYNMVDGQEPVLLGTTTKCFLTGEELGKLYCEFELADGSKGEAMTYLGDSSPRPTESDYEIRGTGEHILEGAELDEAIRNNGIYTVEIGLYDRKTGKLVSTDDYKVNWNLCIKHGPCEMHQNVNPLILDFDIFQNKRFTSINADMEPLKAPYEHSHVHDDNGVSLFVKWTDKVTFENADRVFYSYETSSKPGEEAFAYMTTLVLDDANHTFKLDRAFVNTAMVENPEAGGPEQDQKTPKFGYDVENIKGSFTEDGTKLTLKYGPELVETEELTIVKEGLVRDKYKYGERFELLSGTGSVVNEANPHMGTWRLPQVTIADTALNEVASQYLDPIVQGMFTTFGKAIEFGELEIDPTDPSYDGNSVKADVDLRFEKNVLRIYGNVSLHAYLVDRKLELGQPFDLSGEASFPYEVVPENQDFEVWNQRMPLKFNVSKDGKVMVVTAAFYDPMYKKISQITFPLVRIDETDMREANLAGGKPFDADKTMSLTDMGPIAKEILLTSGIGPDLEKMLGMPVTLPNGENACVTGRWNIDKTGRTDLAKYPDVFNVIGSAISADGFRFESSWDNGVETLFWIDSAGRKYVLSYSNIRLTSNSEGYITEILADVTIKKKGGYITRLKDVKAVKADVGIEDVVSGYISSNMKQAPFEIIFTSEASNPDIGNLIYRTDEMGFDVQVGQYTIKGDEVLLGVDVFEAMMSKYDNVSAVVYGRFPFDPVTGRIGLLTDKDGKKYGYVIK